MKSKVKTARGRRNKGCVGERDACAAIMRRCPELVAERNARNGKRDTDILVWRKDRCGQKYLFEVKRVEGLDIGTKDMEKIRDKASHDRAAGILWRKNRGTWRLERVAQYADRCTCWATFSGDDVFDVISEVVK